MEQLVIYPLFLEQLILVAAEAVMDKVALLHLQMAVLAS
jgi:hypothetical protein